MSLKAYLHLSKQFVNNLQTYIMTIQGQDKRLQEQQCSCIEE